MCVGIHFANPALGTTCPKPRSSPLIFLFASSFHVLYSASPNFCPAPPPRAGTCLQTWSLQCPRGFWWHLPAPQGLPPPATCPPVPVPELREDLKPRYASEGAEDVFSSGAVCSRFGAGQRIHPFARSQISKNESSETGDLCLTPRLTFMTA